MALQYLNQGMSQQTAATQQLVRRVAGAVKRAGTRRAKSSSGAKRRAGTRSASKQRASSRRASSKAAKFVKGSAAAKRHMAKLRKMRKK